MRIIEYSAENFKRLRLVEFRPKGRMTVFTGKNDQGKSSALDAVPFVLGGKKWSPEMPKRRGAQHMKVRLDMGDLVVTRTDSGLKVETAPGVKAWDTPQKMLDSIFDELAFDPLEFIRMKPDDQVEMLKRCVKLDEDLDALARENAADFDRRREINRDVDRLAAEVGAIAVQQDLPKDKVDEAGIDQRIAQANEHNRNMANIIEQRNRLQAELDTATNNAQRNAQLIEQTEREVTRLEAEFKQSCTHAAAAESLAVQLQAPLQFALNDPTFINRPLVRVNLQAAFSAAESVRDQADRAGNEANAALQQKRTILDVANNQTATLEAAVAEAQAALDAAPIPEVTDTTTLMAELRQAQLVNREIDKRTRRDELRAQWQTKKDEAEKLTRAMRGRDERKAAAIANAKMPIEGLSFTEGEVLFEGVPLQQLGEARQIRISIALVLARNPKLRLVVIKHGEALDDDSMAELQQLADEQDFYVWMAKVDPSGKVGIFIEDGEIKINNDDTE